MSVIGLLYIVPTPIGNLEDMTFRGVRALKEADLILAEDTRRSGRLAAHFGVETPFLSLTEHNVKERLPRILDELARGKRLALVSDAGMPGVSDPGMPVIRAAIEANYRVEVLPGASAVPVALVGSGLPTDRFAFEGFPPKPGGARTRILSQLAGETRTLLFYESPKRLPGLLKEIAALFGQERPVVVARELTKLHETWYRGTAAELADAFAGKTVRGEVAVAVGGATEKKEFTDDEARALLMDELNRGASVREASKRAAEMTGLPKKRLYAWALEARSSP